jgi:hypothetical protein
VPELKARGREPVVFFSNSNLDTRSGEREESRAEGAEDAEDAEAAP